MSAASTTKIFGIRVGIDPKLLVGGLIVLAALLFWYNSRTGEDEGTPANVQRDAVAAGSSGGATPIARRNARRGNTTATSDRGSLRVRPIDPTRGDIDPTLRLDLLAKVRAVAQARAGRSLFEIGPSRDAAAAAAIKGPTIIPKPLPVSTPVSVGPIVTTVNIPLKYYGFVRPIEPGESNRGLFLDGDNVLVVAEGDVVKQRFLVVELTPNGARMEDTTLKKGQTLPVVPVATTP